MPITYTCRFQVALSNGDVDGALRCFVQGFEDKVQLAATRQQQKPLRTGFFGRNEGPVLSARQVGTTDRELIKKPIRLASPPLPLPYPYTPAPHPTPKTISRIAGALPPTPKNFPPSSNPPQKKSTKISTRTSSPPAPYLSGPQEKQFQKSHFLPFREAPTPPLQNLNVFSLFLFLPLPSTPHCRQISLASRFRRRQRTSGSRVSSMTRTQTFGIPGFPFEDWQNGVKLHARVDRGTGSGTSDCLEQSNRFH